jgi:hypothetical protein
MARSAEAVKLRRETRSNLGCGSRRPPKLLLTAVLNELDRIVEPQMLHADI